LRTIHFQNDIAIENPSRVLNLGRVYKIELRG